MNAVVNSRTGKRGRKIKFGSMTITAPEPARALVERNIALSTEALDRVTKRLARPGVRLRPKRGVPMYSIDDDDTNVVIRKLDGKIERGRFEDGEFRPIN